MTVVQFRELKRFTWVGLWTIRFPLVLVAASHLAKFAFMYEMEQTLYYWVFVSYICVQCFLAIFAVSHIPRASSLEPVVLVGSFYQVCNHIGSLAELLGVVACDQYLFFFLRFGLDCVYVLLSGYRLCLIEMVLKMLPVLC